jgi:hypothetical protein
MNKISLARHFEDYLVCFLFSEADPFCEITLEDPCWSWELFTLLYCAVTHIKLSSIAVQATAQSSQTLSVLHLCLLLSSASPHRSLKVWWKNPSIGFANSGDEWKKGTCFNWQNWCHISEKSKNLRFLWEACDMPVKTPTTFGITFVICPMALESQRGLKIGPNTLERSRKKNGTICAFPRDV